MRQHRPSGNSASPPSGNSTSEKDNQFLDTVECSQVVWSLETNLGGEACHVTFIFSKIAIFHLKIVDSFKTSFKTGHCAFYSICERHREYERVSKVPQCHFPQS